MKYLHKFANENDFHDKYDGTGYTEPWVSATNIEEADGYRVDFNKEEEEEQGDGE